MTFLKKNWRVKESFFQNSKKIAKGFQHFLKKTVKSILNDLYEHLNLKTLCQKFFFKKTRYSIIKGSTLITTFSWEKLLLEFAAKLSLQSLCIIHYQLPGVYCRSQKKRF